MAAFKKLGIAVAENPLLEGSDNCGLVAAADQATLDRGLAFLNEEMEKAPELQDDDDEEFFGWLFDMYYVRLPEMGVTANEHDWEHLQLDALDELFGEDRDRLDVKLDYFGELGVELRLRSISQPGDVMKFEIWRKGE